MEAQPGIVNSVDSVNHCSYKTNFVRESSKAVLCQTESSCQYFKNNCLSAIIKTIWIYVPIILQTISRLLPNGHPVAWGA